MIFLIYSLKNNPHLLSLDADCIYTYIYIYIYTYIYIYIYIYIYYHSWTDCFFVLQPLCVAWSIRCFKPRSKSDRIFVSLISYPRAIDIFSVSKRFFLHIRYRLPEWSIHEKALRRLVVCITYQTFWIISWQILYIYIYIYIYIFKELVRFHFFAHSSMVSIIPIRNY